MSADKPERKSRPVLYPGHIPTLIKTPKESPLAPYRNLTPADGRIQITEAVGICLALGHLLQAVPKEARKRTVAMLSNMAQTHRKNGDAALTYLSIEALITGWENWP
ncbi:MAG: hypothetical protein Q8L17_20005 [Polaromonas sp.]|nr:hypothetical protein [Polaromonas sp.]